MTSLLSRLSEAGITNEMIAVELAAGFGKVFGISFEGCIDGRKEIKRSWIGVYDGRVSYIRLFVKSPWDMSDAADVGRAFKQKYRDCSTFQEGAFMAKTTNGGSTVTAIWYSEDHLTFPRQLMYEYDAMFEASRAVSSTNRANAMKGLKDAL